MIKMICEDQSLEGKLKNCSIIFPKIYNQTIKDKVESDITPAVRNLDMIIKDKPVQDIHLCLSKENQCFTEYKEIENITKDLLNEVKNRIQNLYSNLDKAFSIGCLTATYTNRLMWSHYADCYKGICIEYDFEKVDEQFWPFPIVYDCRRPQLLLKDILNYPEGNVDNKVMRSLLIKDSIWEYENEWRILLPTTNNDNFVYANITCIYLGIDMDEHNRRSIIKIAKQKGIPLKEMKLDSSCYELQIEELRY